MMQQSQPKRQPMQPVRRPQAAMYGRDTEWWREQP